MVSESVRGREIDTDISRDNERGLVWERVDECVCVCVRERERERG